MLIERKHMERVKTSSMEKSTMMHGYFHIFYCYISAVLHNSLKSNELCTVQ